MKARRFFILALALLLAVALMTTALVACNPDKGEDTTGENPDAGETPSTGDAIFTEDATLAGLKAALDAAENVTYKYHGSAGDFEYDYIYRFARDCVVAEAVENYDGQERRAIYYAVLKDGVFYDVACEDGQWSVDKNLASNTDADSLPSGLFDEYVFTVPFALEEVDGKLQPKDGAGVLSLDGDSVTLTFEKKEDGVTVQTEAYSLSLVNATEVTVPADVLERINAADWSDRVYYNGIDYNKTLTGASGEETTVYVYDDKNLPLEVTPETTINGFPVIAESELAQQSAGDVIFTEDATLAGIKAAMSTSVSYTYEYTGTFDNENEPYCREVYYITENVARVLCEERDLESGEWSVVYEEYLVEHSGGFFRVYAEQGNWAAEKASTTCEQLRATMYDGVLGCLIESHGAIVPDESVLKNGTHYVEGSARVSLEGARLQLSITYWNRETSPVSSTERYVLRGVNATTVEVPEEVTNAVKAAYATL